MNRLLGVCGAAAVLVVATVAAPTLADTQQAVWDSEGFVQEQPTEVSDASRAEGRSTTRRKQANSIMRSDQLEEVVVTGSRIPLAAEERAQDVKIFTRADIDRSGQTTLTDFLNTISDVSVGSTENLFQNPVGGTSVTLHGLPVGTTLVLINGRRVESSPAQARGGSGNVFFDLNNIPFAAVERVEVVSEGSSAVYGSDAISYPQRTGRVFM